jgi:hypothetical protein
VVTRPQELWSRWATAKEEGRARQATEALSADWLLPHLVDKVLSDCVHKRLIANAACTHNLLLLEEEPRCVTPRTKVVLIPVQVVQLASPRLHARFWRQEKAEAMCEEDHVVGVVASNC